MRVQDEQRWLAAKADIALDPKGDDLLAFIETWCNNAERHQDFRNQSTFDQDRTPPAIDALNRTLAETELQLYQISANWLAQSVVIIISNWAPPSGEDPGAFFESLSPIEQRVVTDMVAIIVVEQNQQAEETTNAVTTS